jgi:serine protease Do
MKFQHLLVTAAILSGFATTGLVAQTAPKVVTVATPGSMTSYLGVGIKDVDSDRAKALKLKEEAGIEVTRVDENSPAEKAGLKTGDVILDYNGQRVEGIEQFSRMVRETPAGREVKLQVWRNGSNQTIAAKVGSHRAGMIAQPFEVPQLKDLRAYIPDVPRAHMDWPSGVLGVVAESIDGQFAEFFGVKEGVLVRSVNKDSAAEKAGIKAGDVIIKVDGMTVSNPPDVSSRLRDQRGKSVPVVLIRDHKEVTVAVTVADDRSEHFFARPFDPHPAWL